jgi:hypothetical protein
MMAPAGHAGRNSLTCSQKKIDQKRKGKIMSIIQVGLVDTTGKLDQELVQAAAAALNIQVMRDLPQFWNVKATVTYLSSADKVPAGVWPVMLVPSLPPGEGGFHMDKHNQPYSKVIGTPDSNEWTIDASHETLEMLVDPYGNRLQASQAIAIDGSKGVKDAPGQFEYLVEACDPCEADEFAYTISGIAVSDFITPHFYDHATTPGTRYSFTGAIKAPRQLLKGGYISFINEEAKEWQQILWVNPGKPVVNVLGPAPAGQNLRVWADNSVAAYKEKTKFERKLNKSLMSAAEKQLKKLDAVATERAERYS